MQEINNKKQFFNLINVMEETISIASKKAKEKNLHLYVNYSSNFHPYYEGDCLSIQKIVGSLISNAIKFTPKGLIEVNLSGGHDQKSTELTGVTIKITDTGIGIAPHKLHSIFENKRQDEESEFLQEEEGASLSLAVVKALVDTLQGSIQVDSKEQFGTLFTITFPLKRVHSWEEEHASKEHSNVISTGKHVLLVEDYKPNIVIAEVILKQIDYDYEIAENGLEALDKFKHCHYNVILMDIQMPELDGLEATRRIRKMESERGLHRTPIIAMTAHVREQDKNKCFEAGMDDYIAKPFDPTELSQKISHYVGV